jgi:hypothetical protein
MGAITNKIFLTMKNIIITLGLIVFVFSCKKETKHAIKPTNTTIEKVKKSTKQIKDELVAKGFQTFDYVDEKTQDTILMQQYFIAFLKSGPERSQSKEETDR